jgi:hypothetical protein
MKLVLLISLSSFLIIMNSYFKRTEAFTGTKLESLEEFFQLKDQSSVLRFCHLNGFLQVAYVSTKGNRIKTIVCANP